MRVFRHSVQIVALMAALLAGACNLTQQEELLPTATPTSQLDSKPVVTIISPASGSEHRVGTMLSVNANVRDDVGVTRVQMSANGSPVKTISSVASDDNRDRNVILDYTPIVTGDVTLQVVAYRNTVASDPAQITVKVVSTQVTPTTGVIVTQAPNIDPNDPTCRALINSPLNFRSGPGTTYSVITTLSANDVIPVTGRLGDNSWYQLNRFGTFGWVSGGFVSLYGSFCVSVPVVAPPATPTSNIPTATRTWTPTATQIPPTITPTPGTPDLVITVFDGPQSITIPSGQSQRNEEYQLTVANVGTRRSGDFVVMLKRMPNGEEVTVNVANLRPGEAANVVIDYTFTSADSFILEAMADSTNVVSEISEANNRAQLAVTVTQQ